MKTRTIGDVTVSAIGFGGMPISIEGRPDEDQAIATIHAALDAGITFIDTADAYRMPGEGFSHNEQLIAKALKSYGGDTSNVLVATKGGHLRDEPTPHAWQLNGSSRLPQEGGAGLAEEPRASTRSASTSSTVRTRSSTTPTRSARSATCSMTA